MPITAPADDVFLRFLIRTLRGPSLKCVGVLHSAFGSQSASVEAVHQGSSELFCPDRFLQELAVSTISLVEGGLDFGHMWASLGNLVQRYRTQCIVYLYAMS